MTSTQTTSGEPDLRLLLLANRTCPCPQLPVKLKEIVGERDAEILIVSPALNSKVKHYVSDIDGARGKALDRLTKAISQLDAVGLRATGKVGDSDPVIAIQDALHGFAAEEIVLSTWPEGHSNWLEHDLPVRTVERFGLPVTHLISSYGLDQPDAGRETHL